MFYSELLPEDKTMISQIHVQFLPSILYQIHYKPLSQQIILLV